MTAVIIGGGIGGLTAAIALEKAGIETHVYERAPFLREVGAGISLWANALHAFEVLGLADAIRDRMLSQHHSGVRTWRGAILSEATFDDVTKRGAIIVGVIHRADLLAVLAREVNTERLYLSHECTGLTQNAAGITAQFANGETARGDLVIGADGLHSVVRTQLFGAAPPRYVGYTAWRAVADFTDSAVVACESWGPGRRFGVVPMKDGRVYWYATTNAPENERDPAGSVKKNLLSLFHGWHDSIEALIEATGETAILRNDIYDRDPLPSWTKNRVTLLGDAAHPMSPNLGQGACQAIEDAIVLAVCLGKGGGIEDRLREYQDRRIRRTSSIVLSSRRIGKMAQWENPFLCLVRNAAMRAIPNAVSQHQLTSVVQFEAITEQERMILAARPRNP